MRNILRNEKGFTLGELLVVFLVVLIVTAVMMPLIQFSHGEMEKTECANNLQEIGLALFIYAEEHGGKFPPSVSTLFEEEYIADRRLIDCPATKEIGSKEDPEYIYVPGLSAKDPGTRELLADKDTNHAGGWRNVLYTNGAVLWEE